MEVKVVEGHGTTIDVVLVNGVLHEGDQIVVCGMQASLVPFYHLRTKALLVINVLFMFLISGTYCCLNSSITDTPSNEGTQG